MIKVIIIDDEEHSQRVLKNMITQFCPALEILAICSNVPEGVRQINQLEPDAVFCDIAMPMYSGLELLSFFKEVDFELIFATGHSEYAIQAFEMSAIGYLLKPIQLDKLEVVVEQLKQKLHLTRMQDRLQLLQSNLSEKVIRNIALPVADGLAFVEIKKIMLLEADGAYTRVWQEDGKDMFISKSIKFFEPLLEKHPQFYKIHRSAIVNVNFIQKYSKREGYLTLLHDKTTKIAREKKTAFENYIATLNT